MLVLKQPAAHAVVTRATHGNSERPDVDDVACFELDPDEVDYAGSRRLRHTTYFVLAGAPYYVEHFDRHVGTLHETALNRLREGLWKFDILDGR